jgi:hypothetical protein
MTQNFREKFISDNISFCLQHKEKLSEWEQGFINSVNAQTWELSSKQYNTLHSISEKLGRKLS